MKRRPDRPRPAAKKRESQRDSTPKQSPHLVEGVHFLQQGQLAAAKKLFTLARDADPNDAVALNCLGIVARAEQQVPEAIAYFRRAIELRPDFAEAFSNLGNAQRDAGELIDAEQSYRRAIQLKPDAADAYNNLAVIYLTRGLLDDAIRCLNDALERQPNFAVAHNNLGNAYSARGDWLDALASFSSALHFFPNSAEIHNNLANVLQELGRLEEAHQHLAEAVRLNPNFVDGLNNLGNVLIELELVDEAFAAYHRAIELQPTRTDSLVNLGNASRLINDIPGARQAYTRASTLSPVQHEHALRLAALCPPVFESTEEISEVRNRAIQDWQRLAELSQLSGWQLTGSLTEPSFHWQFLDGNLRPLKQAYARIFDTSLPSPTLLRNDGKPRIGIVVTHGHEGLFLRSMRGVLERMSLPDADIVIVCPQASEQRIRSGIERSLSFVTFASTLQRAAETIRSARFDVLYYWEIGTDAVNYFLPFLRLAPVQCTSWGIQVTSGISNVDYYISNELVEPADAAGHYSEKLILARSFLTYQFPPALKKPAQRAEFGLPTDNRLYVCAQQPGKFHPDFDETLAAILRSDSKGIVVGTSDRYGHAARLLQQRLARTIPDVASRFVFLPRLDYQQYLQLLALADVLLDPPHFGGVNSTYDALALGKPVVTLPSDFHRGRYTAGCLRKIGLETCITAHRTEYVRTAVEIACNSDLRQTLSERIRQRSELIFHDRRAVEEHERVFSGLIETACERNGASRRP